MYQKYNTDALVLGSRERGESDKMYTLYTRDFGLVRARASAVRTENSKMRYALQNYARANVSLVRGKRGWRVAGASATAPAPAVVGAFARISELTSRLVAGEEENQYLFATLVEAHEALSRGGPVATVEVVCVARLMYTLGYISSEALRLAIFTHTDYGVQSLREAEAHRDSLLKSINQALSETHL